MWFYFECLIYSCHLLENCFSGKGGQKVEQAKPASAKSIAAKPESSEKPKVKLVEPSKDEDDEDSDDDDDDDDSDGDEGSDDESDDEVYCHLFLNW